MKFWKGITGSTKEGQFGTMGENGTVPDSVECTKAEYDAYVAGQVAVPDLRKAAYAALATDAQRIAYLATQLKLI
jgi:hypothetical protein